MVGSESFIIFYEEKGGQRILHQTLWGKMVGSESFFILYKEKWWATNPSSYFMRSSGGQRIRYYCALLHLCYDWHFKTRIISAPVFQLYTKVAFWNNSSKNQLCENYVVYAASRDWGSNWYRAVDHGWTTEPVIKVGVSHIWPQPRWLGLLNYMLDSWVLISWPRRCPFGREAHWMFLGSIPAGCNPNQTVSSQKIVDSGICVIL